jgi:NHL repeat
MLRDRVVLALLIAPLGSCCLEIASGGSTTSGDLQPGAGGCSAGGIGGSSHPGVTTLAGNGFTTVTSYGTICDDVDGPGGPTGAAQLCGPQAVALGNQCDLYVADIWGIRRVDAAANVTTFYEFAGLRDAGFSIGASGMAVDAAGNVYLGDSSNNRIWKVAPNGAPTILAGNGTEGFADGTGGPTGTAQFDAPWGLALDSSGNVYVADSNNNRVRAVDPSGNVTTLAGNGQTGYADGVGGPNGSAELDWPKGVGVDLMGNVYVADADNQRIRKIDPLGNVTTVAGQTENQSGSGGDADGTGGPHGTARFQQPFDVGIDGSGNLYVADLDNNQVREIDPDGNVTTLAGNGTQGFADGTLGPSGTAEFNNIPNLAVDSSGIVYVADTYNNRVRKVTPE